MHVRYLRSRVFVALLACGGRWRVLVRPAAAAAAVWILLTGALYLWGVLPRAGGGEHDRGTLTMAIAQEIAQNHHVRTEVEFAAASVEGLRAQMDRRDLTPVEPRALQAGGVRLLGARSCAVQGQLAAQIKFADASGQLHTLYETRLTERLAETKSGHVEVDGVRVRLWRELGLLMGLASPPA